MQDHGTCLQILFDVVKGESDSLAGLVLGTGRRNSTPMKVVIAGDFEFTVLEVEKNRIQKVKVTIKPQQEVRKLVDRMVHGQWSVRGQKHLYILWLWSMDYGPWSLPATAAYTPKPTGYFKIDFPEKKYQLFDQPGYPYSFEYPVYAKIVKDSTFFGEETENPWWINVDFPQFAGRIYVSYKAIGQNKFDTLIKHAFTVNR
jgi:hypothetical protein